MKPRRTVKCFAEAMVAIDTFGELGNPIPSFCEGKVEIFDRFDTA